MNLVWLVTTSNPFRNHQLVDPVTGKPSMAENAIRRAVFSKTKERLSDNSNTETCETEKEQATLSNQMELQEEELLNKVKEDDFNIYGYLGRFINVPSFRPGVESHQYAGKKRNLLTSEEPLQETPEPLAGAATFSAQNPVAKRQNLEIPSALMDCLKELRHLKVLKKTYELSDSPFLKNQKRNKILSTVGIKLQKNKNRNAYTFRVINSPLFAEWIDSELLRDSPTPENTFLQPLSPMDFTENEAFDAGIERAIGILTPELLAFIEQAGEEGVTQTSNFSHPSSSLPADDSVQSSNNSSFFIESQQQSFSPTFFGGIRTTNPTSQQEIINHDDILDELLFEKSI